MARFIPISPTPPRGAKTSSWARSDIGSNHAQLCAGAANDDVSSRNRGKTTVRQAQQQAPSLIQAFEKPAHGPRRRAHRYLMSNCHCTLKPVQTDLREALAAI